MTGSLNSRCTSTRRSSGHVIARTPLVCIVVILALLTGASGSDLRTYEDADSVVFKGVWDGDTFYATIPGWTKIIGDSIKIRVLDINCLKTAPSQDSTHPGKQAKALTQKVLDRAKVISLKETQRGESFRVVAKVLVDGEDLGGMLVDSGFAIECDQKCSRFFVYATPNSKAYHLISCSQGGESQNKKRLTIEDARGGNLESCYYCNPDRFVGGD
ncbi:MAG: thermonuclease family protein [candidate division Zixibacteria bacterium]|nr:thermonuclease family protein [candidate division Zixibacteria bacterium]MDH3936929.1 thermonuclease family protein [candidate division Zixibacteria bacterium]MDH4032766.1 thermonuclease family protein [candidate division Zixibacteria bacterium]